MAHGHEWCYSNSTVLLPYLIGTNEVQHYFMLQDLSYLPGGFTVFLPVNCSSNGAFGPNNNLHQHLKL